MIDPLILHGDFPVRYVKLPEDSGWFTGIPRSWMIIIPDIQRPIGFQRSHAVWFLLADEHHIYNIYRLVPSGNLT